MSDTKTIKETEKSLDKAKEGMANAAEFSREKADALLATLKTKTEEATTEADRERIRGVSEKIRQLTQWAKIHTTNMIDALRSGLSADQKAIVADADSSIGESIGVKTVNTVKETSRVAQESANKMVDAVKTGNVSEAKKLAAGVVEKIGANGEKIREYAGAAALGKAFEPIMKDGFSLENLFKCIGNFFKVIFGGGTFQEVLGETGGKIDQAKKQASDALSTLEASKADISAVFNDAQTTFEAFKKIPKEKDAQAYNAALQKLFWSIQKLDSLKDKLTPEQKKWVDDVKSNPPFDFLQIMESKEKRDAWIDKQVGPVCANISKEFYAGGKLSDEQIAKVREWLKGMNFGTDTIEKIRKRYTDISDPTAISASDPANLLTEMLLGNAQMLGVILSVVPVHRIVWGVAKKAAAEWMEMYEYNFSVVMDKLTGVKTQEVKVTPSMLSSTFSQFKNDEVMQDMILMQLYRANGLFAAIAGTGVSVIASAAYAFTDTSHGVDGIKEFTKLMHKDYNGLIKGVEDIEKAFAKDSKFDTGLAQTIRNELAAVRKNWTILALTEEIERTPNANIGEILKRAEYTGLHLNESDVIKNSKNIRAYLGGFISTESVNASAFSKLPGRLFGTAAGAGNDFIEQLQHTKQYQSALMKGDAMSKFKEIFGSLKILKMPRAADKVLLYFKDTDSAINTLRQVGAHGGSALSEMIRTLPVAGLVIGGTDIATRDSRDFEGSKLQEFGKIAASVLVPFAFPVMVMMDPNMAPRITKDGKIENLGNGLAMIWTLGIDGLLLARALKSGLVKGSIDFLTERPRDVLRVVRWVNRTGTLIARATPRFIGAESAVAAEKMLVKFWRAGKVIAWLLALGVAWYAYAKSHEDYEKTLIEKGFWDPKLGDLTQKAKDEFAKLSPDEKKGFIDTLSHAIFKSEDTKLSHAKSTMDDDGTYTLVVDTQAQTAEWYTALNQKKHLFEDELIKLGVPGVQVLDKETHKKEKEEAKQDVAKLDKEPKQKAA